MSLSPMIANWFNILVVTLLHIKVIEKKNNLKLSYTDNRQAALSSFFFFFFNERQNNFSAGCFKILYSNMSFKHRHSYMTTV